MLTSNRLGNVVRVDINPRRCRQYHSHNDTGPGKCQLSQLRSKVVALDPDHIRNAHRTSSNEHVRFPVDPMD